MNSYIMPLYFAKAHKHVFRNADKYFFCEAGSLVGITKVDSGQYFVCVIMFTQYCFLLSW